MPIYKVKIPQITLQQMDIPRYLNEIVFKVADVEDNMAELVIKTPSAQFWCRLSQRQKDKWRELVTLAGEDPEDYLAHMRAMLPADPEGKPKAVFRE